MKSRKPFLTFLLISFLSLILLVFLILEKSPSEVFQLSIIGIPVIFPFFILLFLIVFGFFTFLFKNVFQGIIFAIFFSGYFLLRLFGFTNIFFLILVFVLFLVLQFAIRSK